MLSNHDVRICWGPPRRALATIAATLMSTNVFAKGFDDNLTSIDDNAEPVKQLWNEPRPLTDFRARAGIAGVASNFLNTGSSPDADGPSNVAYTPDGSLVIVVHRETDNVTILDVNTRSVVHTIGVGDFPTDVAVTPDGQYAVVPNVFSNSVSVIDIAARTVAAEIPVTGTQPYRVAIGSNSKFAVVGVINDATNSAFSIIDLTTLSETATIPTPGQGVIGAFFTPESGISGPIMTQFALTPDGATVVLPHRAGAQVVLYDVAGGVAQATLATAAGPTSVDISADGTLAVVGHDSPGNAISKIDLVSQTLAATFPTGQVLAAQVVRITPDKSHAIAAISNNIIFVNLATGAIAATIFTGSVGDIELTHDVGGGGQYAFVSNFNARVIDVNTRTLVATVPFAACVEAACSPTGLRAVALNSRFREDIHFYSINGAAAFLEGFASTGAPPEGDAARDLAVSADGNTLVVCHNVSRNVAIVDLPAQTIQAYVDVGDRPLGAAITPDGQHAVVCATDAHAVRVIDLSTNAVVASLAINDRPVHVRISPDSQWAYVLNVAGLDRVSFIQLDGADSAIITQLSGGLQAGSALGYAYTEVSGMELSPDGSVLGVCDSFNDLLRLYDTATRTQMAAIPVGDFPIRVAFNGPASRAYVTNAFGDSVSVIDVDTLANIATVPGIEFPLVVTVDADDAFVYVGNTDGNNPRLFVINAANNTIAASVALSDPIREMHYSASEDVLYAALTDGNLARISANGAASAIIETTPLPSAAGPSDLVFSEANQTAVAAQPIPDGIDIVDYDPALKCPGDTNGDNIVNVDDLLAVINAWGPCPGCPADLDGNGVVNVDDLLGVINGWGECK